MAQRVGRGIALLFHDRGTRRGWVFSSTLRSHFTPGKNRYPFYRRLCGPQGRSGWAENLVPTGIRSRTVQPVVSRYTDWATQPTFLYITGVNLLHIQTHCCKAKLIPWQKLFLPLFNLMFNTPNKLRTETIGINVCVCAGICVVHWHCN